MFDFSNTQMDMSRKDMQGRMSSFSMPSIIMMDLAVPAGSIFVVILTGVIILSLAGVVGLLITGLVIIGLVIILQVLIITAPRMPGERSARIRISRA